MVRQNIDIRLVNIRELESRCRFHRWNIRFFHDDLIKIGLTSTIDADFSNEILKLVLGIAYKSVDRKYLEYFVVFDYEIPELKDCVEESNGVMSFPSRILTIMLSVAIGTMRGLLHSRLANTRLAKYPMPIMNVSEIIDSLNLSKKPSSEIAPMTRFFYE